MRSHPLARMMDVFARLRLDCYFYFYRLDRSYCDRILFYSHEDVAWRIEIDPLPPEETSVVAMGSVRGGSGGGAPTFEATSSNNYCSVNDGEGMSTSDHSPVFCTFTLHPRFAATETLTAAESGLTVGSMKQSFRVLISDVRMTGGWSALRQLDVVFPAPHEVDDGMQKTYFSPEANPGWREEPLRIQSSRHFSHVAEGEGGHTPALVFDWAGENDSKRDDTELHLILRVTSTDHESSSGGGGGSGGSGGGSGSGSSSSSSSSSHQTQQLLTGQATIGLASLLSTDGAVQRSVDKSRREVRLLKRLVGVALVTEGRPQSLIKIDLRLVLTARL